MARGEQKTPKGTKPAPTRLATKHKDPAYGVLLIAKAAARREKRPRRAAKGWAQ